MAKNKYKIFPVFLPNIGCSNKCYFCDQESATSQKQIKKKDIFQYLEEQVNFIKEKKMKVNEIALYGGTITGVEIKFLEQILKLMNKVKSNCDFFRISTRPDKINKQIIKLLKKYNVKTVELGVQSFVEEELKKVNRGHNVEDIDKAVQLLKENGLKISLQLMLGLPGWTEESIYYTIGQTIKRKPDYVRISPVLVLKSTELENMYKKGEYIPLTEEQAKKFCSDAAERFRKNNIKVIRIGLYMSETLKKSIIAGPVGDGLPFSHL